MIITTKSLICKAMRDIIESTCFVFFFYLAPVPKMHTILRRRSVGQFSPMPYLVTFLNCMVRIVKILFLEVVFVAAVQAGVLIGFHTQEKRQEIVSILCVTIRIAMYASPILDMITVIKTRNVKYMPLYASLINLINGFWWIFFSLLCFDVYTLIVYGIGGVLSAAQLILYSKYYHATPRG